MGSFIDLTGKTYGRLTVMGVAGKTRSGGYKWKCVCNCGVSKELPSDHLVRPLQPVTSCGCFRNDQVRNSCTPPDETAFNLLFASYKKRARIKTREFHLDPTTFRDLTTAHCEYCGSPPNTKISNKTKTGSYIHNGIDRVDPKVGYVAGNCVPCCKLCNYMKLAMSRSKFLNHVQTISSHQSRLGNG